MTKVKKLCSKQKQDIKALTVTSEDYSGFKIEDFMEKTGILNIYKLNIYHVINLMVRVKNNTIPEVFVNKFKTVHHYYPTRHSENNFIEPKIYLRLPILQYLHVNHVSGIALLIKIQRQ